MSQRGARAIKFFMPTTVTKWTRSITWVNLVVNIGIVLTGGLVRLTGSGLGCPTWPLCTTESLVSTPEMGIHGIIEFGNRTLTGVVCIAALLNFLAVLRTRRGGMGLVWPTVAIGALVIVQALVGGATVLLHLDPRIVGVHFYFSAVLVALASTLLQRVLRAPQLLPSGPAPSGRMPLALTVAALCWLTEAVGVLATGSGPHAGDTAAARNGLDPAFMHHLHAWPGYALALALLALLIVCRRQRWVSMEKTGLWLLILIAVQIVFGVFQARTGLPVWSVAIHMTLAVIVIAQLQALLTAARRDGAGTYGSGRNTSVSTPMAMNSSVK